jgi:hypothetical protein
MLHLQPRASQGGLNPAQACQPYLMIKYRRGAIISAGNGDWQLTAVVVQAADVWRATVIVCPTWKVDEALAVPARVFSRRGERGVGRPGKILVDEPITLDSQDIREVIGGSGKTYTEAADNVLFLVLSLYSSLCVPVVCDDLSHLHLRATAGRSGTVSRPRLNSSPTFAPSSASTRAAPTTTRSRLPLRQHKGMTGSQNYEPIRLPRFRRPTAYGDLFNIIYIMRSAVDAGDMSAM